jgi:dihydrolipoamide dehydrogenase
MIFMKDGEQDSAEAALAVVAMSWVADAAGLNLAKAGVDVDQRGYVQVDAYLQTSAARIFATGDITNRPMLAPQATQDGFVAAGSISKAIRPQVKISSSKRELFTKHC